ncbi:hypothetical protein HU200_036551 [Digitaria exilis]|uniref:Uncharacterized protein n=1 Tax=Digitaria exilis TaxID=1010633 RepID=A0A835BGE7_9POAL|nr:hypothetical protein HU200_036551 [Digitaria exilis]
MAAWKPLTAFSDSRPARTRSSLARREPKRASTALAAATTEEDPAAYGTLEGYAMWVATGVASAFFASVERCSYIHLYTTEDGDEEDLEEARDRPLMLSRPQTLPEYYYDRSGSSASFAKM